MQFFTLNRQSDSAGTEALHLSRSVGSFVQGLPIWFEPSACHVVLLPEPVLGTLGDNGVHSRGPGAPLASVWSPLVNGGPPPEPMLAVATAETAFARASRVLRPGERVVVGDTRIAWRAALPEGEPCITWPFDGDDHLVFGAVAPEILGWHTLAVASGKRGTLLFHPKRLAGVGLHRTHILGRRCVGFERHDSFSFIEGALDAVPVDALVVEEGVLTDEGGLRAIIKELATAYAGADGVYAPGTIWFDLDGNPIFFGPRGKPAFDAPIADEERRFVAGALRAILPRRSARIERIRDELSMISLEARLDLLRECQARSRQ